MSANLVDEHEPPRLGERVGVGAGPSVSVIGAGAFVSPAWLSRGRVAAIVGSLLLHAGVAMSVSRLPVPPQPVARRTVEVARAPRKVEPPAPSVTSPPPPLAPAPAALRETSKRTTPSTPSPAMAGKAVVAKGESEGPLDFTLVTGEGSYVGGVTASQGTSRVPVAAPAPVPVTSALVPVAEQGGAEDRSAPARVAGAEWDCSSLFPNQAARDEAWVTIVVTVDEGGAPLGVATLTDPGEGFAAAARACAMRQRFTAARARDGATRAGKTAPVRVHFSR